MSARRDGSRLCLQVRDDGPGAGAPQEALLTRGVGLSTTAERLAQLYGEEQTLDIRDQESGGLALTIALPFRTAPPEPAGP